MVLLVAIDHNSKYLMAVPIKNKLAATVAEAFEARILPNMVRTPLCVLTDNGPEFKSEELLTNYNIKHTFSTSYHSASNG